MTITDHECDFPDTCPVCRPTPKPAEEPAQIGYAFPARFSGHCRSCNLGIHVGQMIRRVGPAFVHDGCDA